MSVRSASRRSCGGRQSRVAVKCYSMFVECAVTGTESNQSARNDGRENRVCRQWQARLKLRDEDREAPTSSRSRNGPITLEQPPSRVPNKALVGRRPFSLPLAQPPPKPRLYLLGLDAQPQQPIQRVSTVNTVVLPYVTTLAACQSTT